MCISAYLAHPPTRDGIQVVVVNVSNGTTHNVLLAASYLADDWIPSYQVNGPSSGEGHDVMNSHEFRQGEVVCPTPERSVLVIPPGGTVGRTQRVDLSSLGDRFVDVLLTVHIVQFADNYGCGPVRVIDRDLRVRHLTAAVSVEPRAN